MSYTTWTFYMIVSHVHRVSTKSRSYFKNSLHDNHKQIYHVLCKLFLYVIFYFLSADFIFLFWLSCNKFLKQDQEFVDTTYFYISRVRIVGHNTRFEPGTPPNTSQKPTVIFLLHTSRRKGNARRQLKTHKILHTQTRSNIARPVATCLSNNDVPTVIQILV